jgi:hypothetical protein
MASGHYANLINDAIELISDVMDSENADEIDEKVLQILYNDVIHDIIYYINFIIFLIFLLFFYVKSLQQYLKACPCANLSSNPFNCIKFFLVIAEVK